MIKSDTYALTHVEHLTAPDLFIVSAVIHTTDARYLMQLRDDKPGLPLRDHWAFFGGEVGSGEAPSHAVLREVEEELSYQPNNCSWFHEAVYVLPRHHKRIVRKAYYAIQIEPKEVASMVQCEGADLRLMPVAEILSLQKVAPWDVSVVLLHAREDIIFQP